MLLHLTFPFSHINIFYVRNQNTIGKEEDEQMFFFFFLVHQSKPNQTNTLLLYYIKIQYSTTNNNNNNKLYPTKEGHVSPVSSLCCPSVPLSYGKNNSEVFLRGSLCSGERVYRTLPGGKRGRQISVRRPASDRKRPQGL